MTLRPRPWLDALEPYVPGQTAPLLEGSMASNESPLPVSRALLEAIQGAARTIQRYPDPLADEVRQELARLHGVSPDQILIGNGSDELIYLLGWAYLAGGGSVVCADPAYRMNTVIGTIVNARITQVPLRDWHHDLAAMARIEADIAFVVNPHNPTGTLHSRESLVRFIESSRAKLIVVDEAYIDFCDDPEGTTAISLTGSGRVAVLRTFSKAHGMAGLRIGYLLASPEIIRTLRTIRPPFSVGTLAQAAAVASLRDRTHFTEMRDYVCANRTALSELLAAHGFSVVPSQSNFVLAEVPAADRLIEHLRLSGVAVRPGASLGVPGTVRVSVPSHAGLELIAAALTTWAAQIPATADPA
ncbi:histidinol-phosphate transaminase [Nocardioides sp. LMS-CY]|uniref:histidinol-phosphate transaminase n=1 Tax=Nocardioides sp. (strain LMS-CY) TaxID=2840457 RepID=UPI001C001933|nr:histidinol-phosphate transaminase [Nocardioides sp. LMS-CY]QWF20999.1 histidinol-phosphate transaminase [Nocardioides sp. LMS-CY]